MMVHLLTGAEFEAVLRDLNKPIDRTMKTHDYNSQQKSVLQIGAYYWIRRTPDHKWEVAKYFGNSQWDRMDNAALWTEHQHTIIGPRIPDPDKGYSQPVNQILGDQEVGEFQADSEAPSGQHIRHVCNELADFLIAKNKSYGNSALEPVRCFSKADTVEQINVRLDDKISRLMRGDANGEDVEEDLLGYLILKRVWACQEIMRKAEAEKPDLNKVLGHREATGQTMTP